MASGTVYDRTAHRGVHPSFQHLSCEVTNVLSLFFYCIRFACIFIFVHEESALKCSLEDGPRDGEARRKISRNLLELLPPGTDKARGAMWIPQLRPLSFNSP